MSAPTEFKRLFLQSLKWDSEDSGETFFATLKSAARARLSSTSNGKILVSTGANGKNASFSVPSAGDGVTPTDIVRCLSEFLDGFSTAQTSITARGDTVSDNAILTEMLAFMGVIKDCESDYSEVPL